MGRPKKFSKDQLIEYCRNLYKENGMESLSFSYLKEAHLYHNLYSYGITQKMLLQILGIEKEFEVHKKRHGWTWERVLKEAKSVVEVQGFLPPAGWFQKNGQGSLVQVVYYLNKTWADLRSELNSKEGSSFVESRNGIRWRSHPEASLSNFLYARGINHKLGGKYPEDFSMFSGQKYGYYDLTFLDQQNRWIDVEIWGDKPYGHNEDKYARKRDLKEQYNLSNPSFLGIEFEDCYDDKRLTSILQPYIGIIEPYIFEKAFDKEIPSTHWSNADELIEYCRDFANKCQAGIFPTEEWLRKRGKWKNREGIAYNTLSIYIKKWIGGIRKLRRIIGQEENSTEVWNKEKALAEYAKWNNNYGFTPGRARYLFTSGQISLSKEEYNKACCIEAAVLKYVGGSLEACKIIGIKLPRKQFKESRYP